MTSLAGAQLIEKNKSNVIYAIFHYLEKWQL